MNIYRNLDALKAEITLVDWENGSLTTDNSHGVYMFSHLFHTSSNTLPFFFSFFAGLFCYSFMDAYLL